MNILLIDNDTIHLGRLKDVFYGHQLTVREYYGSYPDAETYDLIVLSGGSEFPVKTTPEVFKEEIGLVRNTRVPVIGICEGSQIIAYSYGSGIKFLDEKTHGPKKLTPLVTNDIFEGMNDIRVYESHRWAIGKLGNELVALAKSKDGFEIIKHKEKFIYGLQFHPEMKDKCPDGYEIFIRIISKLNTFGEHLD